jgi:hypothetical protein
MPTRAPFPGYYSLLRAFILLIGVGVAWLIYNGIYSTLTKQGTEPSQAAFMALMGFAVTLAFWIGTLTVILRIGRR